MLPDSNRHDLTPERHTLNIIRSIIGHATGHETAAIDKIRDVLNAAGEGVR